MGRVILRVRRSFKSGRSLGQISILIVFSIIPIFTLFAFAVNLGALVNAKIMLQNAADMAAYSGAAAQARQLTSISHLNYEMRQAYKKFLFKLYVVGSLSFRCFPRASGMSSQCIQNDPALADDERVFSFLNPPDPNLSGCPQSADFPGVPAVCIAMSADSNPCQLGCPVPKVAPPDCIPFDPVCGTLQQSAEAIRRIQDKSCQANSVINQELLVHWLYGTDPNSDFNTNPRLQQLIRGIGLVPEEILLQSRIETLTKYINEPAKTDVTFARLRAQFENVPDQVRTERTVLAFKSALSNLNDKVFEDVDSIRMSEMLPQGAMLELEPFINSFDAPYVIMERDSDSCNMWIDTIRAEPPIAMVKKGNGLVFYAVKLKARAKILFNPFPFGRTEDSIELSAYSAAMPFGSRIGPLSSTMDPRRFVREVQIARSSGNGVGIVRQPLLPMGDNIELGKIGVLKAFDSVLESGAQNQSVITDSIFRFGLRAAVLPDEFEVGQYNTAVDVEGPPGIANRMISYFKGGGSRLGTDPDQKYTFWAPLFPPEGNLGVIREKIKASLANVSNTLSGTTSGRFTDQTKTALAADLTNRLDQLISPGGLIQKNVYVMTDPLSDRYLSIGAQLGRGGVVEFPSIRGKISRKDNVTKLATSFSSLNDAGYYLSGRDGYSVKHISFRMLTRSPGFLTPGQRWSSGQNDLGGEKVELEKVNH